MSSLIALKLFRPYRLLSCLILYLVLSYTRNTDITYPGAHIKLSEMRNVLLIFTRQLLNVLSRNFQELFVNIAELVRENKWRTTEFTLDSL